MKLESWAEQLLLIRYIYKLQLRICWSCLYWSWIQSIWYVICELTNATETYQLTIWIPKDCKENKYDYQWAYTKVTSQQTLMLNLNLPIQKPSPSFIENYWNLDSSHWTTQDFELGIAISWITWKWRYIWYIVNTLKRKTNQLHMREREI